MGRVYFLTSPGRNRFAGYGLAIEGEAKNALVGLIRIDTAERDSAGWLNEIQKVFGRYELFSMTEPEEKGLACQMFVRDDSRQYVQFLEEPEGLSLRPLLEKLQREVPGPRLRVYWCPACRSWASELCPGSR